MYKALLTVLALAATPVLATGIEINVEGEGANGVIVIDLFEDVAPAHVKRIANLAAEGKYDGVAFHRVIDGFMAQTGDVQFANIKLDVPYISTQDFFYLNGTEKDFTTSILQPPRA